MQVQSVTKTIIPGRATRALFGIVFIWAQVLIGLHHTDETHTAADGLFVECDICIASPHLLDTLDKDPLLALPDFSVQATMWSIDAVISIAPLRFGGPRAPPHPSEHL